MVTGCFDRHGGGGRPYEDVGIGRGLAIGVAQSIAILPVSHAPAAPWPAHVLGVDPVLAAEFPFSWPFRPSRRFPS